MIAYPVPNAIALERMRMGNASPRKTQGVGPQKREKDATCITANAIRTAQDESEIGRAHV